jgi:hypothetical protein
MRARHALAGLNVVAGPEPSESFAGQGQFAYELDEAGVVGIGSGGLAEAGGQPGGSTALLPAPSPNRSPCSRNCSKKD